MKHQPPINKNIIAVEFVFVTADSQIEHRKSDSTVTSSNIGNVERMDMVIGSDDECALALSTSSLFSANIFSYLLTIRQGRCQLREKNDTAHHRRESVANRS
jgi:hypothetical protein